MAASRRSISARERNFDLLICDFQMSPMNGLDLLKELAKSGLAEGWPVIMLSAETNPATIKEAHDLGVRAWVGKPVSVLTLIERVTSVLRQNGQIGDTSTDPELRAMTERRQAHLMAALRTIEDTARRLDLRPREAANLAHGLRGTLDDVAEHARTMNYGLLSMLTEQATEFVMAMENNPAAAARGHVATSRALGTIVTAMKRVAHNRMTGDGAEGGLKLLSMIQSIIAPVRATLG